VEIPEAEAGDIVALPAFRMSSCGETLTDSEEREPLHFRGNRSPTITMKICINDGPLAGVKAILLTARQVRERLVREVRTNVSLKVADTDTADISKSRRAEKCRSRFSSSRCAARGSRCLVSRPEVIFKRDDKGNLTSRTRNSP